MMEQVLLGWAGHLLGVLHPRVLEDPRLESLPPPRLRRPVISNYYHHHFHPKEEEEEEEEEEKGEGHHQDSHFR